MYTILHKEVEMRKVKPTVITERVIDSGCRSRSQTFGAMGFKVYDFYILQPNNHNTGEEMGCGSNYCICEQPFPLQNQEDLTVKRL